MKSTIEPASQTMLPFQSVLPPSMIRCCQQTDFDECNRDKNYDYLIYECKNHKDLWKD